MKPQTHLSWIILCVLGWVAALASLPVLPDAIPVHFGSGIPNRLAGKGSIFLWPLVQLAVAFLGQRGTMLPRELKALLTHSQYHWAIWGILAFVLLLELVIILAAVRT